MLCTIPDIHFIPFIFTQYETLLAIPRNRNCYVNCHSADQVCIDFYVQVVQTLNQSFLKVHYHATIIQH